MDQNPQRTEEHSLSEKQTNTDEHKAKTAIAAVFDPEFPLPSINEKTSPLRHALSLGTLVVLLSAGFGGAWFCGVEILQSSQPLLMGILAVGTMLMAFVLTGTIWVDWFELVIGYWWLTMPIGALAGLAVILNIEASSTMAETD